MWKGVLHDSSLFYLRTQVYICARSLYAFIQKVSKGVTMREGDHLYELQQAEQRAHKRHVLIIGTVITLGFVFALITMRPRSTKNTRAPVEVDVELIYQDMNTKGP